jgi:hypothetical protein
MIHATLNEDLNLSKKSARWVPKLLTEEMKNERVKMCEAFLQMVHHHALAILDQIVTMDESAVAFHTPRRQSSRASSGWERQPGLIKAKVWASRSEKMILAFFDFKSLF